MPLSNARAHRAIFWSTALIALIAAGIVAVRQRDDGERRSVALPTPPPMEKSASAARFESGTAAVTNGPHQDVISTADRADRLAQNPESPGLEVFLEMRKVPDVDPVQEDADELLSEARDPNWSTQAEAQLQSELSQMNLTLTGSYIECRSSGCIVALVRPTGAYDQQVQVGLPNGAIARAMFEAGRRLSLLAGQARQIRAEDGALVHWQRLYRRCAPDCDEEGGRSAF